MPNGFTNVPDWFPWENAGGNVAIGDLAGDGRQDLVVLMVDNPPDKNRGVYRVGKRLDAAGLPTDGWGPWMDIPDWFSFENQGAGLALWDLNGNGQLDLVAFMIDAPQGQNQAFYRVGRSLDNNGNVTGGWTDWMGIPDWFPWENQHGAIAVSDLDGDGHPELIVFMIDNPQQQNQAYYRIGKRLDADGRVTAGWTGWQLVPDWFSWENQGAGVAVVDGNQTGDHDLIIFQIDNAAGQNQAFFKRGTRLQITGDVDSWEPWMGVPGWFSWENQGGGLTMANLGGLRKLIALNIDNPPQQNAGLYEVFDLDSDPAREGRWEVLPFKSGVLAVHAALLPRGKLLFFAGSGSSAVRFASPDFGNEAKGIFTSVVWDPAVPPGPGAPNFSHPATLRTPNGKVFDLFCGGDAFLPDGRMLSAGGTLDYNPFKGRPDVAVFDPFKEAWAFVKQMQHGRWYPTLIAMGDGRVLATTGLNEAGDAHNQAVELYSAATDSWQPLHLPGAFPGLPLYAHLFLMQDGRVFFSGGRMDDPLQVEPCVLNLSQNPIGLTFVPDLLDPVLRNQSASVLLPPAQDQMVMIMGGGPVGKPDKTDATGMVSIVDLKVPHPNYVAAEPMLLPRLHLNAVLLPDRTVFVTGGSLKQEDKPLARLQAETYDPATGQWQLMATSTIPRLYHSTALLLPDGRVVTAGGNPEGGHSVTWEPPDPEEEMRLEVFSPPYLFKGPRPTIGTVVTEWGYGQQVSVPTPQAAQVRWAHLVKGGVTTHSFNCEQRLVDLPIAARTATSLRVAMTDNRNLAPPGWYMLFIVDTNGVPSVATWVHLT
ncbi:MAG: DUF1929 domain-containing protein [Nitrospira sp. LK70]|nr:DUF1929 domain-containing protein [Nitrospira sp. LK70]